MSTHRWNVRMALGALYVCLLGLLSHASAQTILCSEINTSSMSKNTTQFQSHGACSLFCQGVQHPDINSISYAFAILQNDGCWCSNYFPTGGNLTQGCSTPCPGWPFEYCGAGNGHFTYEELSTTPSGTAGAGGPDGSAASSTTAAPVTSTATPSPSSSDDSSTSSSSSETSLSSTNKQASTSETATPIISVFTTIGQVHTITITPTASANSQTGTSQKSTSGKLGTGGAVGLTIGLVALIATVTALLWFYFRRKRKQEAEEFNNASRRGSTAGLGGPIPSRTMSENSRYVLGTDGRQVVETWEPGDAPGSRRSRLMPVDPRLDPFAPVYQRNGDNKSRESMNTIRDDHDYSRRVVHQGPILRATNPDHAED
ncbi:uncharacterized protein K444DRAFT_634905 [Hyaloscypha bicolor E]|uniref:WSC domain-containing protein n=1 Tax=Hyaloscypha bicolor E TaxID=1095630 RepID=A0A2J6STQ5_9HELO|nr:uncharacterized protein K444DRAFT_634905 [Hyaloscypha bicolor E]PMD54140.1 hypothetical protein K444DRAFT_634905 [Hyaloscypha bicolor E]